MNSTLLLKHSQHLNLEIVSTSRLFERSILLERSLRLNCLPQHTL
ncbi:hypothetical protein M3J09_009385 [Ascochyta lentis]